MPTLWKLTLVEIKLFAREPISLVITIVLPAIFLFVLGGVFGNAPDPQIYGGMGPINFYLPAYIGLVIASVGVVTLPVHLTGYRERGVLRRLHASSIPAWCLFGSQALVSLVIAAFGSLLLTASAMLVYDVELPKQPAPFPAALLLSSLSFTALGVMLGVLLPTTRAAQGLGLILFFVMMLLDGPGPPREIMTDTMRLVADLTPLRYVVLLLQDPWFGSGWDFESFLVVAGVAGGATVVAVHVFRRR